MANKASATKVWVDFFITYRVLRVIVLYERCCGFMFKMQVLGPGMNEAPGIGVGLRGGTKRVVVIWCFICGVGGSSL